jgi:hypothetical protein
MSMRTLAAAALLALTSLPAAAQDRTTYCEGSRPRVLINWRSFEANGFPAASKDPISDVVISAHTRLNLVLLDRARGQEMLLVLAPDSGLDTQGRPRETFLITHGAAYIVRDGRFQIAGDGGAETWSVERAAEIIGRFERERDQQRAESPEPRDAAVAVFSGENRPDRPEGEPLEAPKLRKGEALPADVLAKAAPKAIEGAGGDAKLDGAPPPHIPPQTPERRGEIRLDRPLEVRPKPVPKGDIKSHACLRGHYTHRYQTTGGEVFLCCIPVDEILRGSFQCAGGLPLFIFGSPDDIKIRFCSLLHPTASTLTYVRVCIRAPLRAPEPDTRPYR